MNHPAIRCFLLLCLGVFIAGCHREAEPAPEASSAIEAPPASTPAPLAKTESKSTPTPDLANPKETKATLAAFTPPFPERVDLFDPPKRAQSTIRRDEEHGETVELNGFINTGQPRVILTIDKVTSSVPEGGEKYGVRVISIQPPSVVLQRGRNRWTATLE